MMVLLKVGQIQDFQVSFKLFLTFFKAIQGLTRRGLNMLALYKFVSEQCGSRSNATLDVEKLWSINKSIIDPIIPRYSAVKKDKL
jgi:glutamyl-tRNA synthetase